MLFEEALTKYAVPISTVFSNIMVGLVPIVVSWMRYFSTNIKIIGQSYSNNTFYGKSYSLKLENKTLRTFVIDKVNVFVTQERFFTIDLNELDFEKRTLEPFKQLVIKEQWTEMRDFQIESILTGIKFEIFCGAKVVSIKYSSFLQRIKRSKLLYKYFAKKSILKIQNEIVLSKRAFENTVISSQVKFAIHLFNLDGALERTILVIRSGFMSDNIILNDQKHGKVAYNALPPEEITTTEKLINYLDSELFKSSIHKFLVQEIGK